MFGRTVLDRHVTSGHENEIIVHPWCRRSLHKWRNVKNGQLSGDNSVETQRRRPYVVGDWVMLESIYSFDYSKNLLLEIRSLKYWSWVSKHPIRETIALEVYITLFCCPYVLRKTRAMRSKLLNTNKEIYKLIC